MEIEGNPKLKKVLTKLLDPNFKLKNNSYLNSILDHLKTKTDSESSAVEEHIPQEFFFLWLKQVIVKWGSSKTPVDSNVLSFTLNLTTLYSCSEEVFVKLNSENVFERLINITLRVISDNGIPGVKLGYIRLISSFLNHKSGLQWILSTNYWSRILILTLKCDTVYLQKEGSLFLAKLLHKAVVFNETFCHNVIQIILSPLNEVAKQTDIREQAIYQQLCPNLSLLNRTFEMLLEMSTSDNNYQVFLIFKDKFQLERIIHNILTKIQNDDFVFELNKILFILSFFDLVYKVGGKCKSIQLDRGMVAAQKVFDVFIDSANRGTVSNFLKLCYVGHIYWRNIVSKMPSCLSHEQIPLLFENQLLLLQLFPAVIISFKLVANNFEDLAEGDAIREDLVNKIYKNVIPETFRTAFKWRNYLQKNFSFDHATLALKYVLHSKQFYDKPLANTAFQILLYNLRDINQILREQPGQLVVLTQESNYMCLLIETIGVLIKEFDIKWQDSLETVCVMEIIFNFLSFPVWPTKLVVKGLTLLEIAIAKRMSPVQALLIDSTKETNFDLVAPMLYAKLHDSSWEVRDSAMEVVKTICYNANIKFPSFKTVILDADFHSLTLKMAMGDGEPFVRATAFKCLQEMVGAKELWKKLQEKENLTTKLLPFFHQESEGIVRRELATLFSKIYVHQELSEIILQQFYNTMSHAVVADLHWEVKVKALDFWYSVIKRHLTHQGMIDGSFPNVTFSTEHKKIVVLDEREVKKRLIKVLHQLSEIGCLAVFMSSLQDDCDLAVSKTATNYIKNLISLLMQYNITPSDLDSFDTFPLTPPADTHMQNIEVQSGTSSRTDVQSQGQVNQSSQDSIMEDILNSQDLNLLESVLNSLDTPSQNTAEIRDKQIVTPFEFLNFAFGDLEQRINEKNQWAEDLDNFDSLLDDILSEYNMDDVNSMDCY